jgi:FlaG/FlaF family flagellin (archaellin)
LGVNPRGVKYFLVEEDIVSFVNGVILLVAIVVVMFGC